MGRFLILVVLLASVARASAEDTAFYYGYVPSGFPKAQRENPVHTAMNESIDTCLFHYEQLGWYSYAFEEEAAKKEKRFGRQSLDQDDMKWITATENMRTACLGLLYRVNKLNWIDRLKYWWQH